jgi:hypothetical protein
MNDNRQTPAHVKNKDLSPSSVDQIAQFLTDVRSKPKVGGSARGRLVFAMDATLSRQPTWDHALVIQAEMFHATAAIGGLDVQLIYFRGLGECRSSKWVSNPDSLARLMTSVGCRGGRTQIERILRHTLRETAKKSVNALVFVGDAMEENVDDLCVVAGELGLMKLPVFMFHDGREPVAASSFREIARLSGGAYCPFNAASADHLRELLAAVAIYSAGGINALERHDNTKSARMLLEQLK